MTGYTVHTGASKKFVAGWDSIFAGDNDKKAVGKKKKSATAKASSTKRKPKKKS